jgi:hypothetical protein
VSTERESNRIVLSWLRADEHVSADRILDDVFTAVDATPQRRSPWLARSVPPMNNTTVRLIAAVAAVAIVAVIGYQLLSGSGAGDAGPSPSLGPSVDASATPIPSTAAGPINFTALEGGGTELEPGEYVIDYAAPVALVTFTVPDEPYLQWPSPWFKALFDWGPWHQSNAARLGAVEVVNLYVDPCNPALGPRDPAVGPSGEDLLTALGEVPGMVVSAPVDAQLSGYNGQYVELTGEVPADCIEDRSIWQTTRGDQSLLLPGDGDLHMVWILDVEGQRLVIWASEDGGSSESARPQLEALVDSVRITVP